MASTSARLDFPSKSVPRGPIFPGSSIGDNSQIFSKGGGSTNDTRAKNTEYTDKIILDYNSEYASSLGITTEFNKQSFNPIIGGRQNTINGQLSSFLAGGNNSSPNSSNDISISNAGQEENGNAVTFRTGASSAQSASRNQTAAQAAQVLNEHGCPGNQTYAYLTISSSNGSYLPTFSKGGCGCWVSTGADVGTLLGVMGSSALLTKFTTIPGFTKAGRLKNALDKIAAMAGRPKDQYADLLKLKPDILGHRNQVMVKQAIRAQLRSGQKTLTRIFVNADGTTTTRVVPNKYLGRRQTFVVREIYTDKQTGVTKFIDKRKTVDEMYDDEVEGLYRRWYSSTKKYFQDVEKTVQLHGFGGVLEAKIMAYLNPLYTDFVTVLVSGVVGSLFQAISAATIYREKVCLGNNRMPKPDLDCNCKCRPKFEEECGTVSSSIISNYTNSVQDFALSLIFGSDEIAHCGYGCCTGQTEIINSDGECDCQDPDPSTYEFIQGSIYSPNGCNCRKKISSGITGIPPALIPGIYIEKDVLAQKKAVGKIFNPNTCSFDCPDGSHVAEGISPGSYARITDNLGNGAPTTGHYLYETGCNYVCDGREPNSTNMISPWPPDCESLLGPGAIFVNDPTVCNCLPCPDEDKTCVKEMSYGVAFNVTEEQCNQGDPWWGLGSFLSYNDGTNNGDCGYPSPIYYVNPGVSIAAIGRPPDDYGYLSITDAGYTKDGSCSGSCADGTCGSDDPTQEDFYCGCICNVLLEQLP